MYRLNQKLVFIWINQRNCYFLFNMGEQLSVQLKDVELIIYPQHNTLYINRINHNYYPFYFYYIF